MKPFLAQKARNRHMERKERKGRQYLEGLYLKDIQFDRLVLVALCGGGFVEYWR